MKKGATIILISTLLAFMATFSTDTTCDSYAETGYGTGTIQDTVFAGGSGTEQDPFLIENAEQFNEIRNNLSSCYRIISDIDLSEIEFEPIGSASEPFTGVLDGDNNTIKNLEKVTAKTNQDSIEFGLFHTVRNAKIHDLNIDDAVIDITVLRIGNYISYGTMAVNAYSSEFNNISLSGNIKGTAYKNEIGGLVATSNDCRFNTINLDWGVSLEGSIVSDGGMCSTMAGGSLTTCVSNGSHELIENDEIKAGGIVGTAKGGALLDGCVNNTNIAFVSSTGSSSDVVGGMIGLAQGASLSSCNNFGEIDAPVAGGLIGSSSGCNINLCNNYGNITGYFYAGGIIAAYGNGANIINSSNYGNIQSKSGHACGIGYQLGSVSGCKNYGEIKGADSGAGIADSSKATTNCCNFGDVSGGSAGGIVVRNSSEVTGCFNAGSVTGIYGGDAGAAGIAVMNWDLVENCFNIGLITTKKWCDKAGGIVAINESYGLVDKCYNTGIVASEIEGAISATNEDTISDSYYFDGESAGVGDNAIGAVDSTTALNEIELTDINSFLGFVFVDSNTDNIVAQRATTKTKEIAKWRISNYSHMPVLNSISEDEEVYAEDIAIKAYPKKVAINKNLEKAGAIIKIKYNNGKVTQAQSGYKVDHYNKTIGKRKITLRYLDKTASFTTTLVPAKVSKVTLTTGKKKVKIKIKKAEGAKKYEIYRSTQKNRGFKKIKTVKKTTYVNSNLLSKRVYYYKVRATNGSLKGAFSKVYKIRVK